MTVVFIQMDVKNTHITIHTYIYGTHDFYVKNCIFKCHFSGKLSFMQSSISLANTAMVNLVFNSMLIKIEKNRCGICGKMVMMLSSELLIWWLRINCWCGGGKKIVGLAEENKLLV